MKTGSIVYIKSYQAKIKNKLYKIVYINKTHAIISDMDANFFKKIAIEFLTTNVNEAYNSENIKKGDLIKCIDSFSIKEGIVLEVYNTFLLILIGGKRKKVTKNKVVLLNT